MNWFGASLLCSRCLILSRKAFSLLHNALDFHTTLLSYNTLSTGGGFLSHNTPVTQHSFCRFPLERVLWDKTKGWRVQATAMKEIIMMPDVLIFCLKIGHQQKTKKIVRTRPKIKFWDTAVIVYGLYIIRTLHTRNQKFQTRHGVDEHWGYWWYNV